MQQKVDYWTTALVLPGIALSYDDIPEYKKDNWDKDQQLRCSSDEDDNRNVQGRDRYFRISFWKKSVISILPRACLCYRNVLGVVCLRPSLCTINNNELNSVRRSCL